MSVPVILLNSTGENPFERVSKPVVELLSMALTPALRIVGALRAVYCISLGARLTKIEELQDRERARNSLRDAIIGPVLVFVLIVVLEIGMDAVSNWMSSAMSNVTPQFANNEKTVLRLIRRNTAHAGQDTQGK